MSELKKRMIFNNKTLAKILAGIVILGGLVVMFGWFLNIPILTSILPQWVTMKFSTAFSFFLSGLTLFFIIEISEGRREASEIVIPITSLLILILMATLLISVIVGFRSGIEDLFVREAANAIKTTTLGRPSVGTMVSFILIAVAGILSLFDYDKIKKYLKIIGIVIGVLASIAILGYILSVPVLYYAVAGWSTAMAFHTALFFLLLGIGLILIATEDFFVKQDMGNNKSEVIENEIKK